MVRISGCHPVLPFGGRTGDCKTSGNGKRIEELSTKTA